MEAQVEFVVPNDVEQLRDRVEVLESEIAREQAMRRNAEAERDEARRELALLKAAADLREAPTCQLANAMREHAAATQIETHCELTHASPSASCPGSTKGSQQSASSPTGQYELPLTGTQLIVFTRSQQNVERSKEAADCSPRLGTEDPAATESQSGKPNKLDTDADPADASEKRRDPRVASQLSATYWRTGMVEAASCTICDKSSGGARLECAPDPYRNRRKELAVGDQLTLSFDAALERTSVVCIVMWAAGNRCGVRFSGQFHNIVKNTRTASRMKAVPKAASVNMLTRWRSGVR